MSLKPICPKRGGPVPMVDGPRPPGLGSEMSDAGRRQRGIGNPAGSQAEGERQPANAADGCRAELPAVSDNGSWSRSRRSACRYVVSEP
ncbi:uncharacterized protein THITE_2112050 [Thermothielavioides terrestris NRRL 8126]|uniref:Uncharacterized protein n=1 Tax=Thermothielavioides terrestris (strain ATCC 38088 / NRRL 8126) TaxID=578455 RepID=G2R4K4_THETT|nr:uncharacterized protein THITE_2112050 [Thermothielavioides terrestris NRRL 8126]AEO65239.1 hypothetical protein THITE_2112050 [Thermothielavioides terrestris NRRL 8126]